MKLYIYIFFSEHFYEVPTVVKHSKLHFYFLNNDITNPKYFGFLTELGVFVAEVNEFTTMLNLHKIKNVIQFL